MEVHLCLKCLDRFGFLEIQKACDIPQHRKCEGFCGNITFTFRVFLEDESLECWRDFEYMGFVEEKTD